MCATTRHVYVQQSGLTRLAEAAATIDELGQQAQVQRTLLATKQEEADRALTDIQVREGTAALHAHACRQPRQLPGCMLLLSGAARQTRMWLHGFSFSFRLCESEE
jgi:hypothetical protein